MAPQENGRPTALVQGVELRNLLFCSRETDTEPFGFAESSFMLGFDGSSVQVVRDLFQARAVQQGSQ